MLSKNKQPHRSSPCAVPASFRETVSGRAPVHPRRSPATTARQSHRTMPAIDRPLTAATVRVVPRVCGGHPCQPSRPAPHRVARTTAGMRDARPTGNRPAAIGSFDSDSPAGGEKKLRRDQHGLEHQAQRRRMVEVVFATKIVDAGEDVQLCIGGWSAASRASERATPRAALRRSALQAPHQRAVLDSRGCFA